MKPLRLTVEGFTSFCDRLEIDFSGLDLFAITGPTGAGKSSLIDAIVFALYGQVPRVGDDFKQLVSHGAERMSVLFEFGIGASRYRVVRAVRRDRASQQRLERLTAAGSEPIADKAREIRLEVERLLGLDYDGFTRAVVLPQGQFDAFLKGEPKERRKILVALLNLGIYERMHKLANERASAAKGEAEFIRRQLDTDFAGATPEALAGSRQELCLAEAAALESEARLEKLKGATELAQAARQTRRETESLARDEAAERAALVQAAAALADAQVGTTTVATELAALARKLDAQPFDERRHAVLTTARPHALQLFSLTPRLERLAAQVAAKQKALSEARTTLSVAEAALPQAEAREQQARHEETAARSSRDLAHREHLALGLRRGLAPGDPCPVCAQSVPLLPQGEEPALERVEAGVAAAEKARHAAGEALQLQRVVVARTSETVAGLSRELAALESQQSEVRQQAQEARLGLDEARFLAIEAADPEALANAIAAELKQLETARRAQGELEARRRELEAKQAQLATRAAAAGERQRNAAERLEQLATKRAAADRRLDAARRQLLALAHAEAWEGFDRLPAGRDEADVAESLRVCAQRACSEAAGRLATARQQLERIEAALVRAEELRARRAQLEGQAALHKALADLLKANELVAWIQEEALRRLAVEGSRHLAQLSQGRYELRLGDGDQDPGAKAEQDFCVVDHWNGDSVRSVRTLSGGETFLASLALALALAESLAQLSSGERASDALESLFLDEGFGTLDGETLDTVLGALDALHGGQRVVGIVTHVRELADRLPARLEVRRLGSGSGSTAAVV